jgi:N-acetyl-anhydromuramyl-L-alanine amidase AmpD
MTEVLRLSPNQDARAHPIRVIVIHADASPNEQGTLGWLENPKSKVSYHVLIGRTGTKYRCVLDGRRAWAVGYSAWRGARNINGIALSVAFANRNDGKEPLTAAQIASAREVIAEWRTKWKIEDTTTHQIVSRWKDGKELRLNPHTGKMERRKHDPESAPNFDLRDFV